MLLLYPHSLNLTLSLSLVQLIFSVQIDNIPQLRDMVFGDDLEQAIIATTEFRRLLSMGMGSLART